jgi:RNA recognition motif-containing protein
MGFCVKQSPTAIFPAGIKRINERSTSMKIYVGNLPYEITEAELREEFGSFGEVKSVNIITDRYTGRPRGFGFIEMATVSEGQAAIAGLNGKAMKDQTLKVNAARPPSDNRGGGSYGSRRSGGPNRGGWQRRY